MNAVRKVVLSARYHSPEVVDNRTVRQYFCFSADFVGFSGHFPGDPVLPAVVQICMGVVLAEDLCPPGQKNNMLLEKVKRAKFLRKLTPEQMIMAECKADGQDLLSFGVQLTVNGETASSFTLEFSLSQKDRPDA
ncbi:Beta-hydroxyacyl-(acyl-carrier-protein) dehydratase FabA/FabZ [Desulfonatronospira thiodismutans ASO3-1]|uniref:Beta-hydroxyacyl-(Acyl-carrier-protein) dehydratase FabA/FabZ n=1 Tax=Desulfonatronospira thiodismutans ASO3-1 TaxID=555779 RepID=D6SS03_9BACT|nr:Beta-hydroxyacyl-(acyl-carrier-protein) dehydratase FabA/FabZ [Desulfonatronospira thiodismutans]EFI33469.1 Beta-hydroxyacyl-(acyl-carrier-protein) dehydratase FabA/FabZ [Desulfonatronospira thiodismutans ASO3-1]